MRSRGRRLSGFPGLMLVLALAGLLVMHGFDAGAATGGEDVHVASSTARHEMALPADVSVSSDAMPDLVGSDRAPSAGDAGNIREAGADAAAGHVHLGHVMAMCMVVVAVASTGAVRRILGGVRARCAAAAARAATRLPQAVEAGRPPGPGRLELCILRC
jgi:hypothetical protein